MSSAPALSLEDYDAIAAAVVETERGRWFLAEFARRNRSADTVTVLEALARVETRLSARVDAPTSRQQEAARRVAAALDSLSRIRASLADADETSAARAFGEMRAVELDMKAALRALGPLQTAGLASVAETTDAAAPRPASAKADVPHIEVPRTVAPAPAEASAPAPERPATRSSAPLAFEPRPVAPTMGAPKPVAARPVAATAPEPPAAWPAPRPVAMVESAPAARSSLLLDSLSETEKAILFA